MRRGVGQSRAVRSGAAEQLPDDHRRVEALGNDAMSDARTEIERLRGLLAKATCDEPWECKTNRHPNLNGAPWGWIETAAHARQLTWSGSAERDAALLIVAAHNRLGKLLDVAQTALDCRDHEPWCITDPACGSCVACRLQAALDALGVTSW